MLTVPVLAISPFGIFLALQLSSSQELREIAFFTLDGLLVALSIAAAALWGYLFTGNIFERSRHSFLAADVHYVSKSFARACISLSLISLLAAGVATFFAPEHTREIIFLAFRTTSLIAVCIAVISLCSYVFGGAYIGVVISIVFMLLSFGSYTGFSFLPMWITPGGGEASLSYSYFMFAAAAVLTLTLFICEKFVKRDS